MTTTESRNLKYVAGVIATIVAGLILWGITGTATTVDDLGHVQVAHEVRIEKLEEVHREIHGSLQRIEDKIDDLDRKVAAEQAAENRRNK